MTRSIPAYDNCLSDPRMLVLGLDDFELRLDVIYVRD